MPTQLLVRRRTALLALAGSCFGGAAGAGSRAGDPSAPEGYQAREVEGWTTFVRLGLLELGNERGEAVMTLLRHQLYQVGRRLPKAAVAKLRRVRIWVEENESHNPCMAYHPDPKWLKEHGMDPAKAGCVEVSNASNFLEWTLDQPWMVLHELAHAYHDQFLKGGHGNPEIRAAYGRAMAEKLYDTVADRRGEKVRSYAATNPMEYFAEATEAFFGTNDFFPYVRPELRGHDPRAFQLLTRLWGEPAGAKR